jgi:hypothetical protein
MKKTFCFLLLLSIFFRTYSQKYDLIITTRGDSIVCNIDSITDAIIYFEMKSNYNWVSTNINRNEVIEFKHNIIDMNMFVFKPGTSYIISPRKEHTTLRDIQRNSIYFGIMTINYSRMIPGDHIAFTLAGGLSFIDGIALQTETTLLLGGTKHFFEPGILWWHDSIDDFVLIRTGYRYQSLKGFLFRIAPLFLVKSDILVLPSISIGYSF